MTAMSQMTDHSRQIKSIGSGHGFLQAQSIVYKLHIYLTGERANDRKKEKKNRERQIGVSGLN